MKKERSYSIRIYIFMNVLLALYSLSGFFSKTAAKYTLQDPMFYIMYSGMIAVLGLYAIGWQQILKKIPLITAYAHKAVTVVWGMLYGAIFFSRKMDQRQGDCAMHDRRGHLGLNYGG